MYLDIGTQKPQGKPFAINLAIRNIDGEVTRYKYLEFEHADQLSDAWIKHSGVPKRKKEKKPGEEETESEATTTDSK